MRSTPDKQRNRRAPRNGKIVPFYEKSSRSAPEPGVYEAIYALQGTLRGLPLEADLDEERAAARQREDQS